MIITAHRAGIGDVELRGREGQGKTDLPSNPQAGSCTMRSVLNVAETGK